MKIDINNPPKNFLLISSEIGSKYHKQLHRLETKSSRRFRTMLKLLNPKIECYLRVSYGNGNFNDGYYESKQELLEAFEAFCER